MLVSAGTAVWAEISPLRSRKKSGRKQNFRFRIAQSWPRRYIIINKKPHPHTGGAWVGNYIPMNIYKSGWLWGGFHLLSRGGERRGSGFAGNANRAVLDFNCNRSGHKHCLYWLVNKSNWTMQMCGKQNFCANDIFLHLWTKSKCPDKSLIPFLWILTQRFEGSLRTDRWSKNRELSAFIMIKRS